MKVSTTTTTKIELSAKDIKEAVLKMLSEKGHEVQEANISFNITNIDEFFEGDDALTATATVTTKL